jgi:hypothetical protein
VPDQWCKDFQCPDGLTIAPTKTMATSAAGGAAICTRHCVVH